MNDNVEEESEEEIDPLEKDWSEEEIDLADPSTDPLDLIQILIDGYSPIFEYLWQEEYEHFCGCHDLEEMGCTESEKIAQQCRGRDGHVFLHLWRANNNIERIRRALEGKK